MKTNIKILGIESSHDDTSIALVENNKVIFNYKISQIDIHRKYGGTVPEIASREHYHSFYKILDEIKQTNLDLNQIDYIAYTNEPGLIGALQMGKLFAHALSVFLKKPLLPTNHLEGHLASVLLDTQKSIIYPAIGLIVSGGHTNLYLMKSDIEKQIIGQTRDDAIGEVFDKVARILDLGFPGGPAIDEIFSKNKNKDLSEFKLTKPKLDTIYDFSFSGYKTQIINLLKKNSNLNKELLATSFEKSAIDYIIEKIKLAIKEYNPKTIILSGGVSANNYLRQEFMKLHDNYLIPHMKYTTDNGAMIAAAAIQKIKQKK